jgi:dipeptidyl aminopeptidase/acylaminoacyl peptidase
MLAFPMRLLSTAASLLLSPLALGLAHAQSVSPASTAAAQTSDARIASLIQTLDRTRNPTSVAISPDGNYVAWAFNGLRGSELHLTGIAPVGAQDAAWDRVLSPDTIADVTSLAPGACIAHHPAWSPDGAQLAFLSNCSGESGAFHPTSQDNLFVWTLAVNSLKQVSHLHGEVSSIAWSPDAKSIAFLYVENATRPAGALNAMKPWSGVIGEDGIEIQRVYAIQSEDGRGTWLTPERLHVYEFAWAPSSLAITYIAAPPPGENTWWIAKLYSERVRMPAQQTVNPEAPSGTEKIATLLFDPTTTTGPLHNVQIAVPRFSPDGKQIAFIGGLMSDQGSTGGDIYTIPATGLAPSTEPKDLTPNRPTSPAWIDWLDNQTLAISEHVGGSSHITALDITTGKDVPSINLTLPANIISGVDVMSLSIAHPSPDQPLKAAFIRESFDHAPEVWTGPLDNLTQLTHLNDAIKPAWGKSESIDYTNDGFHIQGWLLYPANYDPAKKYPLIVYVHGGPSSALTPRWPGSGYGGVPFSALGYFVFMPNPRGSYGQGEKFTQANVRDFGYGDLRDILAGMDVLEKRFPIDRDREGITGWSYGGYMTMFAVTQTTRFKAAVAGAGIANWQSYYGENSIDQWLVPFFGATVYDDPAVYAKSSPINFIKQARTPTLMVVGDRDGECPAPQSFEFWHALRAEGIKTQLVIYPNEGHHFTDPAHQRDTLKRALTWFETEMPAH